MVHKTTITPNTKVWFFAERTLIYSLIAVFLFITLSPLVWVLSTSLKPNTEAISFPPKILPKEPTADNYIFVLTDPTLARSLINSFLVSIGSTALSVTVSSLGGYAFARFDFKGKNVIMSTILGLFMIPVVINIIPLYTMLANLGLLNSIVALMLTFQILIIPLNVLLMKSYFETIPKELEEAALIDGCSRLGVLRRVTMPLSMPGFAIAAVLSFRFSWNEFIIPVVLSNRSDSMVFQVALYQFISLYRIDWGYLTAGITLSLIPVLVLMLSFQKQMIRGLTLGAIRE
ncbi:MAG TPA: carbohydrate ABC transporter permease [Nitrososphaeraceae archaeon]|jgi:ABC-type glycerol-3-phosphate transport system permease component|nr:carbohydrate ABC transporter permease [Nitrososphaeraceae archaeon]